MMLSDNLAYHLFLIFSCLTDRTLNNYLNHHNKALKNDTFIISRLLNIIIHFELNNLEYIEYELDSIKRWLKNKNEKFKLERSLLTYIKKILYISNKKDLLPLHQNMIKRINQLKGDPFERAVIYVFDFERWIKQNLIES